MLRLSLTLTLTLTLFPGGSCVALSRLGPSTEGAWCTTARSMPHPANPLKARQPSPLNIPSLPSLFSPLFATGAGAGPGYVSFSGSDLDALFQAAQTIPAREFARSLREIAREQALVRAQAVADEAAATAAAVAAAAAAAAEDERAARSEAAAAAAFAGLSPPTGDAARDPNAVIRETLVDLSRRTIGAARNVGRMALAAAEAHPQGDALLRALLGPAEPAVEDAGDARRSALHMRGISQEDFVTALENVRPTGKVHCCSYRTSHTVD